MSPGWASVVSPLTQQARKPYNSGSPDGGAGAVTKSRKFYWKAQLTLGKHLVTSWGNPVSHRRLMPGLTSLVLPAARLRSLWYRLGAHWGFLYGLSQFAAGYSHRHSATRCSSHFLQGESHVSVLSALLLAKNILKKALFLDENYYSLYFLVPSLTWIVISALANFTSKTGKAKETIKL